MRMKRIFSLTFRGIPGDGPVEGTPIDLIREIFEVNIVGQIAVIQE